MFEEGIKQVVDDVSCEYSDTQTVCHFLCFSLHFDVKCQDDCPPVIGGSGDQLVCLQGDQYMYESTLCLRCACAARYTVVCVDCYSCSMIN